MCVAAFIKSDDLKVAGKIFTLPDLKTDALNRVRIGDRVCLVSSEENGEPISNTIRWSTRQSLHGKSLASFNVKSERVRTNQLWKDSYGRQHCLLFCSGFFERQGSGNPPMYYYFTSQDRSSMALAGLWKTWEGEKVFTILTQPADARVASIHPRMPLLLGKESWCEWLDVKSFQKVDWKRRVTPCPDSLNHWPVTPELFRTTVENDESILQKITTPQQIELSL